MMTVEKLGLYYLSSVGREWETKLKDIIGDGQKTDSIVLKDFYIVLDNIKKKVSRIDAKNHISITLAESNEYVNMPDGGKILLVDDDIVILKLLKNAFTLEGYKVYICDDS